MFINYSNHPIANWSSEQREAVIREFGSDMRDVPFPNVLSDSNEEDIARLADDEVEKIMEHSPDEIMCQGEFTLVYAVVNRMKAKGIKCVAACSERKVREYTDENGNYKKELGFEFVRFREYV